MNRRILIGLAVILTLVSTPLHARDKGRFLTPQEMLKAMEKSKTSYKMDTLESLKGMGPEEFADVYWPRSDKELEYPWIDDDGKGGLTLTSYKFEKACMDTLKDAEAAYGGKDYERAAGLYKKAIEASPKCYFAYIGLGDCAFFTQDYGKAIESYQKAIDLNPYDFRGFFFKAHALVKLKRFAEARESYIESLALKPYRKSLIKSIAASADDLGATLADQPFLPKSLARLEGDTVAIYSNPEDTPWFWYAICKGFWLGEPDHRKNLLGKDERVWSNTEERECLALLVVGYEQAREDDKAPKDPDLERIRSIFDDKMLDGFIFYEMNSRLSGDTMLLLPANARKEVKDYIARYVLAPRAVSGGGQADAEHGS
jgi:tetratricopeptide (TPR) repeat protein